MYQYIYFCILNAQRTHYYPPISSQKIFEKNKILNLIPRNTLVQIEHFVQKFKSFDEGFEHEVFSNLALRSPTATDSPFGGS